MNDDYDDTADIQGVPENLPYFRKTFLTLHYVHIFYAFWGGYSPASEFYMSTFHLHRQVVVKND